MPEITMEMVRARMSGAPWPSLEGLTRDEKKVEYATRFAALMFENDPAMTLEQALEGPFGGWATAEAQLRIEAMQASGMSDDEIEGACRSYEFHAGLNPMEVPT